MPTDSTGTVGPSAARRWAIVVVSLAGDGERVRLHQRRRVSDPRPRRRSGHAAGRGGVAVVDAELRHGGDADPVGLAARPGGRTRRADGRLGADGGGGLRRRRPCHSMVAFAAWLFVGGMAAASCNSAGGRLVSGWFPPEQRGLAMGVRQTAQPLGIALGALVIPDTRRAQPVGDVGLIFPAVLCAAAAVLSAVAIKDPPRKERADATEQELANPYRGSWVLRRIHAVSALLMVPQTLTVTFMLIWLIANYRCSIVAAGCVVTVSQLLGAVGPDRGRQVVGPGRLAAASGPHHGRRGRPDAGRVGVRRSSALVRSPCR